MSASLQWHFGPGGSDEQGPNDPITTTFKGNKYYSLAREVIQNSLDVADPFANKPVKVTFSLIEVPVDQIPSFADLATTYRQCADYFSGDEKFKKFCTAATNLLKADKITCLRISDYNTLGMEYFEGDKNPFYAFMKSVGYNFKATQGAGGSFGYGKGAYYLASKLRTLLVSSVYGDGKYVFQGRARVTTHKDGDQTTRDHAGLYGRDKGAPVTRRDDVPEVFRRTEKGTDIFIMGFHQENNWNDTLIKSVLNNFWLSILENKLTVVVEERIINQTNLEETIRSYYKEADLEGSVNEPESWNPYPYFKAVKYDQGPHAKYFQEMLPTLGQVKLWLYLKEGLQNRTVYMRSPRMTVFKKTDNRGVDYAGVFLCDNDYGNKILRQMENPQHNEWKKSNYLENDDPNPDARKAETELKGFMTKCLSQLVTSGAGKTQKISGLEEYLNIPEDLLEQNDNTDGESRTLDRGNVTLDRSPEETSVETTYKQGERPVTLAVTKRTTLAASAKGTIDQEGSTTGFSGPPPTATNGSTGKGQSPAAGTALGSNSNTINPSDSQPIRQPLQVTYRVIAQTDSDGSIRHLLKIFSPRDAKADLELFAGLDTDSEGNDSLLSVLSAGKDTIALNSTGNKIKAVPLQSGWNLVTVNFDSNQKHSLKLKSYEIQ